VSYLSASAVVIHYEEALYQVYAPFTFLPFYLLLTYLLTESRVQLEGSVGWGTAILRIGGYVARSLFNRNNIILRHQRP